MANQNSNSPTSKNQDQAQNQPKIEKEPVPNPKVQAPENVLITHGYKPSSRPRGRIRPHSAKKKKAV